MPVYKGSQLISAAYKGAQALSKVGPATLGGGGGDFDKVKLLCSFEGTDGATSAVDDSNSGHTLTFVNAAQIDTAQKDIGVSSLLLDGVVDQVTLPNHADWKFGADPFTIEFSLRNINFSASRTPLGFGAEPDFGWSILLAGTSGRFSYTTDGSSFVTPINVAHGMTALVWHKLCMERDANSILRFYIDGVMKASALVEDAFFSPVTSLLSIGNSSAGTQGFRSHIDEIRITKGKAWYASDGGYTPSTEAFPRS